MNRYLEKVALVIMTDPEAKKLHKQIMRGHDVSLGTTVGTLGGNILGKFIKSRRGQIGALVGGAVAGGEAGDLYNRFVRQKERE